MRKNKKEMVGTVISDKMNKTIVVRVSRHTVHPVFNKTIRQFNKFKAHDEKNEAKTGDRVKIRAARRLSRDKRWNLIGVLEKAR